VNWEAIGAIGEIVGGAGVIVSLVYLATQIRTQNKESRLAAVVEWTTQWNAFSVSFAERPALAELWAKGAQDFSSLSQAEVVQFSAQVGRFFRVAEGLHDQYSQGRLDPKAWRGFERTLQDVTSLPGVKAWWPTRSHWHSEKFAAFVTPFIDSTEPQRMYGQSQPR
jgi:hypothetical protein